MAKENIVLNEEPEIWQQVQSGSAAERAEARERLVEANMQLVFWLARRLLAVAVIGRIFARLAPLVC